MTCETCGWRGIPTFVAGWPQPRCPCCRPDLPDVIPSRNQPCPCGSGRKVKKCCGGKVRRSRSLNTPPRPWPGYSPARWGEPVEWANLVLAEKSVTALRAFCGG